MNAPRAILLTAVSTPEQAKDEHASLTEQSRVLHKLAAENGWQVVDVIEIPGASRNHYTYREFCDAAASGRNPIVSPQRMWDHWAKRDFDILAAVTFSRIGRDSISIEVTNRTVDSGARLYSIEGGWIEQSNHRVLGGLAYIVSSLENDEKTRRHSFGIEKRAERGLPPGIIKWTHRPIVDARGKIISLELREDLRRLFDDIHDLFVHERHPYAGFEAALTARGHLLDGKPLTPGKVHSMLHHPLTYGHVSLRSTTQNGQRRVGYANNFGRWAYRAVPPPEGAIVYWNAVQPVWPPDQEAEIIAEAERRRSVKGRAKPRTTHWFTGLFICDDCGWKMSLNARQYRSPYLRCQARYYKPPACDQVNAVPVEECRLFVDRLLHEVVKRGALPTPESAPSNHEAHLASITAEHDKATAELTALIELQGRAVAAAAPHYQARIDLLAEQIAALDQRRRVLLGTQQAQADSHKRQATAISEIAADLPFLWTLSEAEINQRLYRLLGDWRISVVRGRIKGLVSLV